LTYVRLLIWGLSWIVIYGLRWLLIEVVHSALLVVALTSHSAILIGICRSQPGSKSFSEDLFMLDGVFQMRFRKEI